VEMVDDSIWKNALRSGVMFAILSPYDSELSDLLHRLKADKSLNQLPDQKQLLEWFTTEELIHWTTTLQEQRKGDEIFQGEKGQERWEDFHKRIVQHNLRVMGLYYSRITSSRLAQLLQLSPEKCEAYVSEMVSSKQLYAKIDRPAGIVRFKPKQLPQQHLNNWAGDIADVLGLVEKTCHLINKEKMLAANSNLEDGDQEREKEGEIS